MSQQRTEQSLVIGDVGGAAEVTFGQTAVLDISTSQAMARELLRLVKGPPPPRVIVNFSNVRFLASRMLGILVEMTKMAHAHDGHVVVCGLRPELSRIFHITRLNKLLAVAATREEALDMLGVSEG